MKYFITLLSIVISLGLLSCKKDSERLSILGSWNCVEDSDYGQRNYQVTITRNQLLPDATNEYVITNFNNIGFSQTAEVYIREETPGTLTITGSTALHVYFNGTGIIADDYSKIEWTYYVNDGMANSLAPVFATFY